MRERKKKGAGNKERGGNERDKLETEMEKKKEEVGIEEGRRKKNLEYGRREEILRIEEVRRKRSLEHRGK